MTLRVAVGSGNPAKLGAARAVLARLGWDAEVLPAAVGSGVAAQPVGETETRRGALQRAVRAREAAGAGLGVGMEGGVAWHGAAAWLINWCAVESADGRRGLGRGLSLRLPPAVAAGLRAGRELGDVIEEIAGRPGARNDLGAVGVCTAGLVTRRAVWEGALACALAPLVRPDLYLPQNPLA